ncbi:hypothetical protein EJ03DRAFT_330120 [Teratosphaeria nubilosa]|uniref:Uncharacterized protein n=1 Tax=Teratosphaeria nubilosa TaxID=161662 RepID=A0A6G1L126_9PEZI|nr:hypothetical protein EJ03DRAFT_330120 [Teratosphaeria nubilosa]
MADKQTEADIILNRANVALARSQRLIASWLPPKPEETTTTQTHEEDSDWAGEDELAGVGSKRKAENEGLPDGVFKRRNLASNDKLLEQIMGKKAAQAKRKQDARKGSVHAAPKPMSGLVKQSVKTRDESEEEEEGRAAAFKPRKQKRGPQQNENVAEAGKEQEAADYIAFDPAPATATDSESEQRPQKKVKGTYLDEILGQKAKKSKKKKKNNANAAST